MEKAEGEGCEWQGKEGVCETSRSRREMSFGAGSHLPIQPSALMSPRRRKADRNRPMLSSIEGPERPGKGSSASELSVSQDPTLVQRFSGLPATSRVTSALRPDAGRLGWWTRQA